MVDTLMSYPLRWTQGHGALGSPKVFQTSDFFMPNMHSNLADPAQEHKMQMITLSTSSEKGQSDSGCGAQRSVLQLRYSLTYIVSLSSGESLSLVMIINAATGIGSSARIEEEKEEIYQGPIMERCETHASTDEANAIEEEDVDAATVEMQFPSITDLKLKEELRAVLVEYSQLFKGVGFVKDDGPRRV